MAGHGPFSFVPGPRKAGRESIVPTNLSSLSLPLSLCNDAVHRLATFSRGIYSRE